MSESAGSVRDARMEDAAAIAAIYAPFVERTTVSFEELAPSAEEMAGRIESIRATHPWLVAERDGSVAGFAYACPHRARAAYRFSADVSVYVGEGARGRGVGRTLYARLLGRLALQGCHRAYAGIALPNEASVSLHRAMGFEHLGTYREVGFKLGRWHDVAWWERGLDDLVG